MKENFIKLIGELIQEGRFYNLIGEFKILNKEIYPNEKTFIKNDYLCMQENQSYREILKNKSIYDIKVIKIVEFDKEKTFDKDNNTVILKKELYLTSSGYIIEVLMSNIITPLKEDDFVVGLKNMQYKKSNITYTILNKDWYEYKYYYKQYNFFENENCTILYNRIIENIEKVEKHYERKIKKISDLKNSIIEMSKNNNDKQ